MAYQYEYSAGNPEGTDFTLSFEHDKEYTREEFKDIMESVLVEWAEDKIAKGKNPFFALSYDCYSLMEKRGFRQSSVKVISYYLEPYWGIETVKNLKLKKILEKQ